MMTRPGDGRPVGAGCTRPSGAYSAAKAPATVAAPGLDALAAGEAEILAGDVTRAVRAGLAA